MKTIELVEVMLRVGAFGCFIGHGWIAAWKLEFSGWKKFMFAAGFTEKEAHLLMPVIGWMDIVLATITLIQPTELTSAWMVVWAFSTAMIRPFSAGLQRALDPMNDNALWGFVERAANWAVPLCLLILMRDPEYSTYQIPNLSASTHVRGALGKMNGCSDDFLKRFMLYSFGAVWGVVPILRARRPKKPASKAS